MEKKFPNLCYALVSMTIKGLPKYPQRALRFGCRFGGVIFLALPILAPWGFFWGFLLNLGFTAPNYLRRPPMRSSKAPPNQKNRGQVLPTPSEPSLRAWQVQRSSGVFRHFQKESPPLFFDNFITKSRGSAFKFIWCVIPRSMKPFNGFHANLVPNLCIIVVIELPMK